MDPREHPWNKEMIERVEANKAKIAARKEANERAKAGNASSPAAPAASPAAAPSGKKKNR